MALSCSLVASAYLGHLATRWRRQQQFLGHPEWEKDCVNAYTAITF